MSWELYEVWTVDDDGHESLIDTTQSLKEAQELAKEILEEDDVVEAVIYRTNDIGEPEQIQRLT